MSESEHSADEQVASPPADAGSTEFRLGIDIEVNTDDEEIVCQHYRVKRIENIQKCKNLKKLAIIASCVQEIEGLEENGSLEHLEVYQGLLRQIRNIDHLTNLRVLDLSFNKIKKIENISSLVNLEKLFLSNNRISVVENLGSLSNLKVLELGANRIRSVNSECFRSLTNLEELWLGKNKITDMNDLNEFRFPNLKQLSLQSNRLVGWSKVLFSQVAPGLTNVYFGSNRLPDMDPEVLGSMNPDILEELDISCNIVTGIPQFPNSMRALAELWLNDNKIEDVTSFKCLKTTYPNLRTIYIERNPVHSGCQLECRNAILENAPATLEQIDASMIPRCQIQVNINADTQKHSSKTILKH